MNNTNDPGRPRRIFLIGLVPLAVGLLATAVGNQVDSNLGGILPLVTVIVESGWLIYLSNK